MWVRAPPMADESEEERVIGVMVSTGDCASPSRGSTPRSPFSLSFVRPAQSLCAVDAVLLQVTYNEPVHLYLCTHSPSLQWSYIPSMVLRTELHLSANPLRSSCGACLLACYPARGNVEQIINRVCRWSKKDRPSVRSVVNYATGRVQLYHGTNK